MTLIPIFLANGFEEIEALTVVDILRRAKLDAVIVGVGTAVPTGAHDIQLKADMTEDSLDLSSVTAVVLPGGMPGTLHLEASGMVQEAVRYAMEHKLPLGAICAAPSILGHAGYLQGVHAVCYPGFEKDLNGAVIGDSGVVTDGNITTAAGAGVAVDFALELVRQITSVTTAEDIRRSIQCR